MCPIRLDEPRTWRVQMSEAVEPDEVLMNRYARGDIAAFERL
jgi:hypothetical protein